MKSINASLASNGNPGVPPLTIRFRLFRTHPQRIRDTTPTYRLPHGVIQIDDRFHENSLPRQAVKVKVKVKVNTRAIAQSIVGQVERVAPVGTKCIGESEGEVASLESSPAAAGLCLWEIRNSPAAAGLLTKRTFKAVNWRDQLRLVRGRDGGRPSSPPCDSTFLTAYSRFFRWKRRPSVVRKPQLRNFSASARGGRPRSSHMASCGGLSS